MSNKRDLSFERRQFERLGDMIGMGEHLEEDGKWILKEYKRLQKILLPEETKAIEKKKREDRIDYINGIVKTALDRGDVCSRCKGQLEQVRKGSYIVKCRDCGARFKYKVRRK